MASPKLELRELRGDDIFPLLDLFGKLGVADKLPEIVNEFSGDLGAPVPPRVARTSTAPKIQKEWEEHDAALEKFTRDRGLRIGALLAKMLLSGIGSVRSEINSLLASLTDTTEAEISALGLKAYFGLVKDLAMHPDFREVFSSAVSSATAEDTVS